MDWLPIEKNSVVPTLKSAVPGDITYAIGYRTMTDILQFIKEMDKIVEGFADPANLLYAPEIKFYSNKVVIDNNFESSIKGLYSIGDGVEQNIQRSIKYYQKAADLGISRAKDNLKKIRPKMK